MKKILIGLMALVVLLVAAVLVVPGLIDWSDYKEEITVRLKEATGRDITLGGALRLTILPAPALLVSDVAVANIAGASSPSLARAVSLEARIAAGPLLTGNLQIETVRLVEPTIELEVLADGRKNWVFAPAAPEAAGESVPPPAGSGSAERAAGGGQTPSVRLDSFVIENGTVTYRDAASGTVERIEAINAEIAAASLNGPFESRGSLSVRGMPVGYDVTIGSVIHGRTVPVTLTVTPAGGGEGSVLVTGTVVGLADVPTFKGKVKAQAGDLAAMVRRVAAGAALPAALATAAELEGAVRASAERIEVADLTVRLGEDLRGEGSLTADLTGEPAIEAALTVRRLDLDAWLAGPMSGGGGGSDSGASVALGPRGDAPTAPAGDGGRFALPTGIGGNAELTIEAVTFRGGLIQQVKAIGQLAGGELTVSQLSAQLPGAADVAVFGFVTAPEGKPRFEGQTEMTVGDLHGILAWLGADVPGLPADRLRKLTLKSNVAVTPDDVQAAGIDLAFDGSRLTGGVTVALRARPAFGADLTLDRLDLDAYLPASTGPGPNKASASGTASGTGGGQGGDKGGDKAQGGNPLAGLSALNAVDANLRVHAKNLTYRATPIKDLFVDATLFDGKLDVRRASVGDLAGVAGSVKGVLGGLNGLPSFDGVQFDATAQNLAGLFAFIGTKPPVPPGEFGGVALRARLDGSPLMPTVDLEIKAAGGNAHAAGGLTLLPGPSADLVVDASHESLRTLLKAVGVSYRPGGRVGGFQVAGRIKGNAERLAISELRAAVGDVAASGTVAVALDGPRPKITADLTAGEVVVDPFLPESGTAALDPSIRFGWPGLVPAAARGGDVSERWSAEPLDLQGLHAVDAEVRLKAKAVAYDSYRLDEADLDLGLDGGILTTRMLTGRLYGGPLELKAVVRAAEVPQVTVDLKAGGVSVGEALRQMTGKASASGTLGLTMDLASAGGSVRDLVSALGGTGSLALTGVDVDQAGSGTALAGVMGLLNTLGGLGGSGGKGAKADVTGSFAITGGLAHTDDLVLKSNLGNGSAKGDVDLPAWTVDVAGNVTLGQGLVAALVAKAAKNAPQTVPFTVKGPLDAPNVTIDTRTLAGAGLAIPGVKKLLEKDKGVGKVLNRILPGLGGQVQGPEATPPAEPEPAAAPTAGDTLAPPPPAGSETPQQQPTRTEDAVKQLFKGIFK